MLRSKGPVQDHFSTIFRSFVAWPLLCNVRNLRLTPDTPRQLSTSSAVENQSLISFRRILSRLHLLRRLSHLLNNASRCTKIYIWPVLQWRNNVGAEWWCLKVHAVHLETLYTRKNTMHDARWSYFTTTTRILFVFSSHVFFLIW